MKTHYLIAIAAIGAALAAPVSAHHNIPFETDLVIGDMQDNHEEAIMALPDTIGAINTPIEPMDPADGQMDFTNIDPQPNGVNIPDSEDVLGPVNTRPDQDI
jgi:hypothetical protein